MVEVYRTPDDRFVDLPDFPYQPRYLERDGLRVAYVEAGDGAPVLLLHGEPTWSFLWRHVLPPLLDAGRRVIVPDLIGFGRSDKPTDPDWYSYDRHTELMSALVEDLDLRDLTLVLHDWGGPIGLRLAVEAPDRVSRFVLMDTGLFTGRQQMSEAWHRFRAFVERTPDLPIGFLVRRGCARDPGATVAGAYDAPFPTLESKAGARAFPLMLPLTPDTPGGPAGQRVLTALQQDRRPTLMLWGAADAALPITSGEAFASAIGRSAPRPIPGAGHYLQEDAGAEIGSIIAEWLAA